MKKQSIQRPINAPSIRRLFVDIVLLLAGSLAAALAVNVFYLPLRLTMGGLSGVASIIFQLTGQGNLLSMGGLFVLLNIPVFLLGWRMFGLRFVWRSLVGSVFYSVMLDLTQVRMSAWFANYINRPLGNSEADPLIYCLFGGVLYGVGLGLIFRRGYTTGGTDILAVATKRKLDLLSVGQLVLIFDAIVILSSVVAYRDTNGPAVLLAMYSFIALFLTSKSMDLVIEGFDFSKMAYIITDRGDKIAAEILQGLQRGVTRLTGQGMYTGKERVVLLCVLPRKQLPQLKRIVTKIDGRAFMIVGDAKEVLGEGFGGGGPF